MNNQINHTKHNQYETKLKEKFLNIIILIGERNINSNFVSLIFLL